VNTTAPDYAAAVPHRDETLVLRGVPHRLLRWGPASDDPILLLHGFLDCAETFQFMVDALPRDDGGVELRADPWHRLTNPILYRREEAEACWRRADLPMLLVVGAESEFHGRLGADGTNAYFRGIFVQLDCAAIDAAGHMMHHEQPAAVADAIRDWAMRQP